MHGKRVGIYVDTRRYQCQSCNKTFYEPLPDVDEKRKMTKRLLDWVGRQAITRTFTSIADEVEAFDVTLEDDEVSIVRTHEHATWWKKTSLGGQGLELREAAESIRR